MNASVPNEKQDNAAEMSPRMKQTLDGLLRGQSEKQIARALSISYHTVHVYVKAVYRHYRVNSRPELLALWIRGAQPSPHIGKDKVNGHLAALIRQRNSIVKQLQELDQEIAAAREKVQRLDRHRSHAR